MSADQVAPASPLALLPTWIFLLIMPPLGALSATGLAPLGFWFVTLIALAMLFALFPLARSPRQAGLWVWLFGAGYFAFALSWITEPFQVQPELHGWMAPFALVLMAGGLALFWGAAGWGATRLTSDPRKQAIALVITLGLAEFARAYILTGFPWAGLAQIWLDTSVAFTLAKLGPHGLALLTFACAFGMAALIHRDWRGATIGAISTALLVLLAFRVTPVPSNDQQERPLIRIVQPNAPQHEKFAPDKWRTFFWRQIEATGAAGTDGTPDLIVWPETSIPMLLEFADEALGLIAEAAQGTDVVLGGQRRDQAARYYNSLFVLGGNAKVSAIYDKHHLVPFGEYMPFPDLFRRFNIFGLAARAKGGYAAGTGPKTIKAGGLRAVPLICYEAVFPNYASTPGPRPDLLMQITNDAWFGTYAGPQQHLAQARMRAIEQGLPLVRSANTGISAMIDPRGRILASLPLGTHGFVDARLPAPLPPTLYSRTKDWPAFALLLMGLIAIGISRKIPQKGKSH